MGILVVKCPVCQQPVEWTDASPWRPFCSRRCKDSDFCAWAHEEHVIGGDDEGPDLFSEAMRDDPER
jgi:hypothetical protein